MRENLDFIREAKSALANIDPSVLLHNENEFWLIQQLYEYIQLHAVKHHLLNTMIALPLVRGLHNGVYRKFGVVKGGVHYKLPYYFHCLSVCRMLADMDLKLPSDEEDIVLASALCHDLIEDIPFANGGRELYEIYHLDKRVYETVLAVSKRKDFTEEQHIQYFDNIMKQLPSLLVKLSDRGNNVEDLYNMSAKKMQEYLDETERYFLPMADYGLANYPAQVPAITILKDKILTLTYSSEVMIDKLEERNQALRDERDALKLENNRLKDSWRKIFEEVGADE